MNNATRPSPRLPWELLVQITNQIDDKRTLCALRATHTLFRRVITPRLFRVFVLLACSSNEHKFGILNDQLRNIVHEMVIAANPTGCSNVRVAANARVESNAQVTSNTRVASNACITDPLRQDGIDFRTTPATFRLWLQQIQQFEALYHLVFNFSPNVVSEFEDELGPAESVLYRSRMLEHTLSALVPSSVRVITMRHLQATDPLKAYGYYDGADYSRQLTRTTLDQLMPTIRGLHLDMRYSRNLLEMINPDLREFPASLQDAFLRPAQNVTDLTLFANFDWGVIPRINLKGLHFPALRRLALSKVSIATMHIPNWIISHKETLKTLIMRDCKVVDLVKVDMDSLGDDDNYLVDHQWLREEDILNDLKDAVPLVKLPHYEVWEYHNTIRWHHIASELQEKLTELIEFRFDSAISKGDDMNFDESFETRYNAGLSLQPSNYMCMILFTELQFVVSEDWCYAHGRTSPVVSDYQPDIAALTSLAAKADERRRGLRGAARST